MLGWALTPPLVLTGWGSQSPGVLKENKKGSGEMNEIK